MRIEASFALERNTFIRLPHYKTSIINGMECANLSSNIHLLYRNEVARTNTMDSRSSEMMVTRILFVEVGASGGGKAIEVA